MPTYNIDMRGDGAYEGWGKAASELAKALTPDYEGQANAMLRSAQVDQAYAGADANRALARERSASAAKQERLNRLWTMVDAEFQELPYEERLREYHNMLFQLGEVDAENFGDWALSGAGVMNATGAGVGEIENPDYDPNSPVSVFNMPTVTQTQPMFDDDAMQNLQIGSGMSFQNTMGGFRESEENKMARAIAEQELENTGAMERTIFEDENKLIDIIRDGVAMKVRKEDMIPGDQPVLTEAQAKGGAFASLPIEQQQAIVTGTTGERSASDVITVDRTFAPVSRKGEVVEPQTRRMSIYAEQLNPETDVVVKGGSEGSIFNYVVPGGEGGQPQTFLTRDGVTDLNGRPLPRGGYRAGVTGSASDTGVDLTESQARNTRYLTRAIAADEEINNLVATNGGTSPMRSGVQFFALAAQGSVAGTLLANIAMTDEEQAFMGAAYRFLAPALRSDTGAAAPITEYPMYFFMFIPMPGDTESTLAAKQVARGVFMDSLSAGLPKSEALRQAMTSAGEDAILQIANTEGGRRLIQMNGGIDNRISTTLGDEGHLGANIAAGAEDGQTSAPKVDFVIERDPNDPTKLIRIPQ